MGINIYNANSVNNCAYTMGSGSALDQSLTDLGPGVRVFRSWFYQHLADGSGQLDWSEFDHTLQVAQQHGVKVIVTLADQWGSCDTTPAAYKPLSWYQGGYRTAILPGWIMSYRDYVRQVVSRYAGNPTIAMWQLMNEAEDSSSQGGACDEAAGATALRAFADDVGGLVKSLDKNHLVNLGTIGGGQCGSAGSDYGYLYSSPQIDLCEYHDYSGAATMPGDQWNGLAVRLQQCGALGKPLFVGESGLIPDQLSDPTLAGRAAAFQSKFQTQIQAGVAGELIWAWMDSGSTLNNYDVGPGDPAISVIGRF